jgi:hypothetical protein
MNPELVAIGVDLLAAIARLIFDAVSARDPATLRKVSDVLPSGHSLRARAALAEARARASVELGG